MRNRKEREYVTLPYDFVPLAEKQDRYFPYRVGDAGRDTSLPKHNDREKGRFSGKISYRIDPLSPLVAEVRDRWSAGNADSEQPTSGKFISGSALRGKVRSNLEILGACYPDFIDRSPLLYRKITSRDYQKRLFDASRASGNKQGIEYAVQVGFLQKLDNQFYVVPAAPIGDKYFMSIKEHRLKRMGLSSSNAPFSYLYDWDDKLLDQVYKKQHRIDRLTIVIKKRREAYKAHFDQIQPQISSLFTSKFSVLKNKRNWKFMNSKDIEKQLLDEIEKILRTYTSKGAGKNKEVEPQLKRVFQLTAQRWRLKLELIFIYDRLAENKNPDFLPYQKKVTFKRTNSYTIEQISFDLSQNLGEYGYLFNSTNASSKRSHYLIKDYETDSSVRQFVVPQSVRNAYNSSFKKMYFTEAGAEGEIAKFYDIFEEYDQLTKLLAGSKKNKGIIVFFKSAVQNGVPVVTEIGRTPYFRLHHLTQIEDVLGERDPHSVDYANALFGFIPGERDEQQLAYKSRVRFSAVDIVGTPEEDTVHHLTLLTPRSSAASMYIQQPDPNKLVTYESPADQVKLNGYKYYHILKQPIRSDRSSDQSSEISSSRNMIKPTGIHLKGTIYFHNLSADEIGLLLLSLDCKLLGASRAYHDYVQQFASKLQSSYESVGGAKPYGYGKVRIDACELLIEKEANDLESLVLEPMWNATSEWHQFIDAFLVKMGGATYFKKVNLQAYIDSKQEVDEDPERVNWSNLPSKIKRSTNKNKNGGYPETWVLKSKHLNKNGNRR